MKQTRVIGELRGPLGPLAAFCAIIFLVSCSALRTHRVPITRMSRLMFIQGVEANVRSGGGAGDDLSALAVMAVRDWERIAPYTNAFEFFGKVLVASPYVLHWENEAAYEEWYLYDHTRCTFGRALAKNCPESEIVVLPKRGVHVAAIQDGRPVPKGSDFSIGDNAAVVIAIEGVLAAFYPGDETYWVISDRY